MDSIQLLLQLNQHDTENDNDNIILANTQLIPTTSERIPLHQIARSEVSSSTPSYFMSTEREREREREREKDRERVKITFLRMPSAILQRLF